MAFPPKKLPSNFEDVVYVHGIVMGLSFAILFPLGATVLRAFKFQHLAWFHGIWQLFAYALAVVGFCTGVWMTRTTGYPFVNYNGHKVIGTLVIGALFLQPILGIPHHVLFKKTQKLTPMGVAHRWIGRIALVLGGINGGLGLQLARNRGPWMTAYAVLAGFFYVLWFVVLIRRRWIEKKTDRQGSSIEGRHGSTDTAITAETVETKGEVEGL